MTGPGLVFASADGGSAFMAELAEVIAAAVRAVGGRATTHVGPLPEPDADTVYVVVPHEYLVVTPPASRPRPELLARMIGLGVEHPGTATFETSASLIGRLAAAVDISAGAVTELSRRGIRTHRFVLGYSPLWDAWGGRPDSDRDIDVAYLATAEPRRSRILGRVAPALSGRRLRWLTPPHEPMVRTRADFLMGADKHRLLARSRVLINLHRQRSGALEWVRYLEAACNGCVVVTEPSSDLDPLLPGRDLVVGAPRRIGDLVAALLTAPDLERDLRMHAYETVKSLDVAGSARRLVDLAEDVLGRAPAARRSGRSGSAPAIDPVTRPGRSTHRPLAVDTPPWDPAAARSRAASLSSDPDRFRARLAVARSYDARRRGPRDRFRPATEPFGRPGTPVADVQVLIVRKPGDPGVDGLLDDLALGTTRPTAVLVAVDGGPVREPWPAGCHLWHNPMPGGVGWSRNRLLHKTSATWTLVIDGDLRADPGLLERLTGAGVTGGAAVVHCPVGDPAAGLVAALPAEPRRLRAEAYLGSGYLVRTGLVDDIGGWTEDPWCDDLVDQLFWSRVLAVGATTELVQHPLLRRTARPPGDGRAAGAGTRPLDLDPATVWGQVDAQLRAAVS